MSSATSPAANARDDSRTSAKVRGRYRRYCSVSRARSRSDCGAGFLMLKQFLNFRLVFAIGEMLVEPERVLLVEDAILQQRHRPQLVLAMHDVIDDHPGLRRREPFVRRGTAQQAQLG